MLGKFEIKKSKDGQYYFILKATNGEIIIKSEMYTTISACENGIESVKKNAIKDELYERKLNTGRKPCFNLRATNGQIIGTSQTYESRASCENGIQSVKKNAPSAMVEVIDIE